MRDNQDFVLLLDEVRRINKKAYLELLVEVKRQEGSTKSRWLDFCIDFNETPQGKEYWQRIHRIILKNAGRCKHGCLIDSCGVCEGKEIILSEEELKMVNESDESEIKVVIDKGRNYIFEKGGIRYKRCYKCEEEKEMNKENFPPNSIVPFGYENQCNMCKKKYIKDRYIKKKGIKDKPIKSDVIEVKEIKNEYPITLDLTEIINKHPEVYEDLKNQAESRIRPIEHHALWLIKIAMDNKPIDYNE